MAMNILMSPRCGFSARFQLYLALPVILDNFSWNFSPKLQALGFAERTPVRQRRVDRVDKRPELRRSCLDIDPHGELAERGAAHRADGRDERSVEALLKRRLFAAV